MAISSGVTVTPLSSEEIRQSGFTHRCTVPYSALVQSVGDATISDAVAILDVGVGDVVDLAAYVITEAFTDSDGSQNSLTVKIGDDGNDDRFMITTGTQLAEDGTEVDYWHPVAMNTAPYAYTAANTVDAIFTAAGGANPTIDEITAGSVDIYLRVYSLKALSGRNRSGS